MQFSQEELNEFKAECSELLEQIESALLELAKSHDLESHFDSIFRSLHSVKGAAGMIGNESLQSHMHELESFFTYLKGQKEIDQPTVDMLLTGCDKARSLLGGESLEKAKGENEELLDSAMDEFINEASELLQRLNMTLDHLEKNRDDKEDIASIYRDIHTIKGSAALFGFSNVADLTHVMESRMEKVRSGLECISTELSDSLYKSFDLLGLMIQCHIKQEKFEQDDEVQILKNFFECQQIQISSTKVTPITPEVNPSEVITTSPTELTSNAPQTLRVSVDLLDRLMTLTGEMVLVRNQVTQYTTENDDLQFLNLSQRLDVVTNEVQTEVMKMRMQPIGNVLNKFKRVVRDMAKDLNKKIDIHFYGNETELDKALLESVKDPLMHIVRNACDHGIEDPEVRLQNGKEEKGNITIKSFHEGGQVIIEISDDGQGLSRDKIIARAIDRNLTTSEQSEKMNDKDIYNFIFAPGFSTAAKVTNISGRGVGMDVVKKNIEKIGGVVDIDAKAGKSTAIRLKIPLTLAIVPAMIINCDGQSYSIPQVKVLELVRIEKGTDSPQIEDLQGKPVYRLRDQLLPIIDLKDVLTDNHSHDIEKYQADITNIVVVKEDNVTFGLIVDDVKDTADIVVKPLNRLLKSLSAYSGATILGDGSISLILDIHGIASLQDMNFVNQSSKETRVNTQLDTNMNEFLLVKMNSESQHAIPLSMIQRMEEFDRKNFEKSGDVFTVQYRNSILPIIPLNTALGYQENPINEQREKIPVVVVKFNSSLIGLQVDDILDVFSSDADIDDTCSDRDSIMGNIIHLDKMIVIIDILATLKETTFFDKIFKPRDLDEDKKKVLLAEDSKFFRKYISKVLEDSGYDVLVAENGEQALSFMNASQGDFHLIISDIEMPVLNGFELAKAIKKNSKWAHIPLVALTTRFNESAVKEGQEVGFNTYLEKMNAEVLLSEVERVLQSTINLSEAA